MEQFKRVKVLLVLSLFLLTSCLDGNYKVKPLEIYKNKGIVVIREPETHKWSYNRQVRCKTKDSVFFIYITDFDAKNLKVGDTIK